LLIEIQYEVSGELFGDKPPPSGRWETVMPYPTSPEDGGEAVEKLLAKGFVLMTIRIVKET